MVFPISGLQHNAELAQWSRIVAIVAFLLLERFGNTALPQRLHPFAVLWDFTAYLGGGCCNHPPERS